MRRLWRTHRGYALLGPWDARERATEAISEDAGTTGVASDFDATGFGGPEAMTARASQASGAPTARNAAVYDSCDTGFSKPGRWRRISGPLCFASLHSRSHLRDLVSDACRFSSQHRTCAAC